jgi:hypothetical protein
LNFASGFDGFGASQWAAAISAGIYKAGKVEIPTVFPPQTLFHPLPILNASPRLPLPPASPPPRLPPSHRRRPGPSHGFAEGSGELRDTGQRSPPQESLPPGPGTAPCFYTPLILSLPSVFFLQKKSPSESASRARKVLADWVHWGFTFFYLGSCPLIYDI